jgi:hypothetical protein
MDAESGVPMEKGNPTRIVAIDLARGLAISLMILSHGVKGLLSFDQFTTWGLVPIHLLTKFSSTTFFLVFGLSLTVSFAPATQNPQSWPAKRKKLLLRGLLILFWYKILTIVEMSHLHQPVEILDALLYRSFPSYTEILGFYALALLWLPFVLPWWQKCSLPIKACWPLGLGVLAYLLSRHFDFGQALALKAVLVEEDGYYTWGQLSRAPIVFLGMFIGQFLVHRRALVGGILAVAAVLLFSLFLGLYGPELQATLFALARNHWKHPPQLPFILFSLAGALGVIAMSIWIGERAAKWLWPITLIGKDPLAAFNFHIIVLFVFFRMALDLWLQVSYTQALWLSVLLIAMTAGWIQLKLWRKKNEASQVSRHAHLPDRLGTAKPATH